MHRLLRFPLIVTVGAALAGCFSTPTVVSYKGQPVNAFSALSMTCTDPYEFVQDCSGFSGPTLRVKLRDLTVKVAGSSDGRIILVISQGVQPTQYLTEQAADAVQAEATTVNAKVLRIEGVALGGHVPGYILHFDKDVYTTVKKSAVD